MDMQSYVTEIKDRLTGGLLELEITDEQIEKLVTHSFREVQRYIDTTKIATIPFKPCIDLTGCGVSSVVKIHRAKGFLGNGENENGHMDPMYVAQWQLLAGMAGQYNLTDWVYRFASWNTALQVRNTVSTDLAFRYDKQTNYLYINSALNTPDFVTIEFVPRYNDVSEIVSDYWIDILVRLATANVKVVLGRIRTRYTQSNALWTMDGETMLNEGITEQTELREVLRNSTQLCYPID